MSPFFSIVMPTKNRSFLIGYAIESILRQTFADFELVIVDNDDTDETRIIVETYHDQRIRYLRTGGLFIHDNFEAGIQQTEGKYVLVLQDKQALKLDSLERIKRVLDEGDIEAVTWLMDGFHDNEAVSWVNRVSGNGSVEEFSTDELLTYALNTHFYFEQLPLPRAINACISRDVIRRIITGPMGRACPPVAPDYSLAFLALSIIDKVVHIDDALSVFGGLQYSLGGSCFRKDESALKLVRHIGDDSLFLSHVPIKSIFIIGNGIFNNYCRIRAAVGGNLERHPLNLVSYFRICQEDIVSAKQQGVDMAEEEKAYFVALEKQDETVKQAVLQGIRPSIPPLITHRFERALEGRFATIIDYINHDAAEKGLDCKQPYKVFVTQDRRVFEGKEAEIRLHENNDAAFLSENGIIQVPRERWEIAQRYEHDTWMTDCRDAGDDRNHDHKRHFGDYAALAGRSFSNVLELGCGPFTNLRLILPQLASTPRVTLLDPLINDYRNHPHCSYRNGLLCGIPVETVPLPIEEFRPGSKYDLVVISNVLEHCYDIPRIFEVILACLSPSGMLVFADNMFDKSRVEAVARNTYDAGHPLRVTEDCLTAFLETNFEPLHQRRLVGLYSQENRIDLYYIGSRKMQKAPVIHFVYAGNPLNDDSIRAPETITNHVYRYLKKRADVRYYDLTDTATPVSVGPCDIVIGHPHPRPGTMLQRLFRKKCAGRFLLWPFHSRLPEINRYAHETAAQADKLFAVSGPYWTDSIAGTEYAGWQDKIVRLDNAIDTDRFPLFKKTFNPPGSRGLFVFGRSGAEKGTVELFTTLLEVPGPVVIAGTYSEQDLDVIRNRPDTVIIGQLDWRDSVQTEYILERCDFFVNMSVSDASPTTLLESMAMGLIPVTTPQCGYHYPSFLLLNLDNREHNTLMLRDIQQIAEQQLRAMQAENRRIIETTHSWSRFCATIWSEISPFLAMPTKEVRKDMPKPVARRVKVAGEVASPHDLTAVDGESEFARAIKELFTAVRPARIIETGTYHGEGTTRVIAETLRELGLDDTVFCSIECNPDNYRQAMANLAHRNLGDRVTVLHGLSVPRSKLPTIQQIEESCVNNIEFDEIFVDHQEQQRALLYYKETDFTGVADDMLGKALEIYEDSPDFVLLDSGGHMGNVEFNYLVSRLRGPCYLALDDIFHIKHHKSFKQMQHDPRFEIVITSKEKFGFCIARFIPGQDAGQGNVERILWVRPDSIGDNVLSMAMLPHIRNKYQAAEITVLCQDHIAELYEPCPYVNAIIPFNKKQFIEDVSYRDSLMARLVNIKADICLNSVYSRDPVSDLLAVGSGAREITSLVGDLSNMTEEVRSRNNAGYQRLLQSDGEWNLELERHKDFLKGSGIDAPELDLQFWVTKDDIDFADSFFEENHLSPEKTIALFAGAQYEVRIYKSYGKALSNICDKNGFEVIALGAPQDYAINQDNLNDIATRSINLCGKLSLRQSAAVLSRCRFAVGAETGLAHIACAVGTPNIILLGGGHFGRFMPYSPLTSIVCLPLECYGCNWQCRYDEAHCVKSIAHEAISEAISQAIADTSSKPRLFLQGNSYWNNPAGRPLWSSISNFIGDNSVDMIPLEKSANSVSLFQYSVSAIVSTYKSEKFIRGCLQDLVDQTLFAKGELEIIVIDSCSPENEKAIVAEFQKEYPGKIKYMRTATRETIYKAWNRGISLSSGKYITNANTDDRLRFDSLEIKAATLESHSEIALVYADQIYTDKPNDSFETTSSRKKRVWAEYEGYQTIRSHCMVSSQPMWRHSLHDKYGNFEDNYASAGDWEFWLRIGKNEKFLKINQVLGIYYENPEGVENSHPLSNSEGQRVRQQYGISSNEQRISGFAVMEHIEKRATPLVSVVIPCFNYAHYLRNAVESVVSQTFRNFEIIIVNDGSTDNSKEVAEQLIAAFPQHAIRLINQENSGNPAITRNRGIAEAHGAYILPLDADDMLMSTMLEECLKVLEQDQSVSIAYTDRLDFDGVDQVVQAGDYNFALLKYQNHISYCAMFRRKVWEDVGGYRPVGCEDWDFWIAAGAGGHYGRRIPLPLFKYRRHDTGRFQQDSRNFEIVKARIKVNNQMCYSREEVMAAESLLGKENGLTTSAAPLVSVIVPTHNRPDMLVATLRSILNQTWQNYEIIVVNDAGADVEGIVNHLNGDGKITYARHARNRGLAAARNTGIKLAQGKYIAYLDDDDLFYPEHLETLVTFLEGSAYKVAYTDAHRAHQIMDFGRYAIAGRDLPYSFDFDYDAILVNNFVPVLCFMHEKSCVDESGLFDESMTTHEDWDMWIRMSRLFRFAHLKKVTCEFTWRQDGSTMSSSKKEDFIRTARMIYEKHRHLAADKPAVLESQRRALAAREPATEEKERQGQVLRQGAAAQPEPAASAGNENDLVARRLEQADNLVKEGKFSEALAGYQSILGIDTNNHRAMTGIGVIRLLEGKRDEAGISFDRALRIAPDDPKALCGAGMVEAMKGRDEAAFDCFSRALDSDPENLTALGELIKCSYRLERFTEAERYLENYLRYHPADFDMLFSLAGIQFRVGKSAEAMDNIEKLLIFAPEYDGGQELKEKIGAMPGLNQAPAYQYQIAG